MSRSVRLECLVGALFVALGALACKRTELGQRAPRPGREGTVETAPLVPAPGASSTGDPSPAARSAKGAVPPAQKARQAAAGSSMRPKLEARFAERQSERDRMVAEQIEARGVSDPRVLKALRRVPRHHFVPPEVRRRAYGDSPLPIVGRRTISQPYIVAFMTEVARPAPTARCLEIGTGSGYQAAVLAEVCAEVYSIEYLPEVAAFGRRNLEALSYLDGPMQLRVGDGYAGWPERAPFDVIIVTAAPERVPEPLLDQLALGGRLVIPVGGDWEAQELELWTRRRPEPGRRSYARKRLMGVRFVPFLGPRGKGGSLGDEPPEAR